MAMTSLRKDLLLRSVPADVIKALKRASIDLDQPMGRVVAGLIDEFLGLYVTLRREPQGLTTEEAEQLRKARDLMARVHKK